MPGNANNIYAQLNAPFTLLTPDTQSDVLTVGSDGGLALTSQTGPNITFQIDANGNFNFGSGAGVPILGCTVANPSVDIQAGVCLTLGGVKVLGAQGAAITPPSLTAPNANETALKNAIVAILNALQGSTGHGLIAG